ncbi:FHA domain-containing protein [Paludisphaera mucosa]|uniref:FHA domain-containing protein n=1 Tax=Paludisphaera mucosa TaxID=3030827 RepID=A0ABT6FA05_9BACT|nr:FHA domain-containing protein [Paludisphaera mucosa]MDG3004407.1 FHA domain-containing protein [Paludisphaera mucosa]
MNYTLKVVKGRSDVTALRLIDGVNSVGRHDDCVIRIRSSQVSRRHCEVFEADGRLMVRDLGSSNGTYVNGKRVLGQQPLKAGDVIGIGGVALRVDPLKAGAAAADGPSGDTAELDAVVDAVEVDEADDFEVSVDAADDDGFDVDVAGLDDAIPLDDEPEPAPAPAKASKKSADKKPKPAEETVDVAAEAAPAGKEDDAVAQFLMDLKLDDDE